MKTIYLDAVENAIRDGFERTCHISGDATNTPLLTFDGVTFNQERDGARLTGQYARVFEYMRFGGWCTLSAISKATGAPEASVSARLRDLRKPRFGGHTIEREYVRRGLWKYRLIVTELFA